MQPFRIKEHAYVLPTSNRDRLETCFPSIATIHNWLVLSVRRKGWIWVRSHRGKG